MRLYSFVQLLSLAVAAIAVAVPINDNKIVQNAQVPAAAVEALNQLTTQLNKMRENIAKFDGDPLTAIPILDSSTAIINTMKSSEEKIQNATALGISETYRLLAPLVSLNTAVGSVTKALIAKKAKLDEIDVGAVLSDQLDLLKIESKKMIDIVVTKLPAYMRGAIAAPFYQPILDKVTSTAAAFKSESKQTS
jgi:hypothetical protein